MEISFKVTDDKILRQLDSLDYRIERRLGLKALRAGMAILRKEVRNSLKKIQLSGTLYKSLKTKQITAGRTLGMFLGVVGVARRYAHIVEFGNSKIRANGTWRRAASPEKIAIIQKKVAEKLFEDLQSELRKGN